MNIITQEQLDKLKSAGLKAPYVNETCIGCSACVAIAGDVFDLDEEGKSHARYCETYNQTDVDDAISACPVDAISWQEPETLETMGAV